MLRVKRSVHVGTLSNRNQFYALCDKYVYFHVYKIVFFFSIHFTSFYKFRLIVNSDIEGFVLTKVENKRCCNIYDICFFFSN